MIKRGDFYPALCKGEYLDETMACADFIDALLSHLTTLSSDNIKACRITALKNTAKIYISVNSKLTID